MSDCTVRPRLLSCPFCGGEAEIVSLHPYEETLVGICCSRCPAIFADGTTYSGFKEYDTEAEVIAAWNTRAPRKAIANVTITAEQVEEIKRCCIERLEADAERTHAPVFDGKWFRCSACNESLAMFGVRTRNMEGGKVVREIAEPIRFCPWCGAKVVYA